MEWVPLISQRTSISVSLNGQHQGAAWPGAQTEPLRDDAAQLHPPTSHPRCSLVTKEWRRSGNPEREDGESSKK